MNPTRTYDYLALARARVLDWVRPLPPDQYTRDFPIGLGSLARTLTHIHICEWYYIERMQGRAVPAYEAWPIQDEHPPASFHLEAAWTAQAVRTRAALADVRDWDAPLEYQVTNDQGVDEIVTSSAADLFTQLVTHEVHHRAQAMAMLRHLGVPAQGLDFNTLMHLRRPAPR